MDWPRRRGEWVALSVAAAPVAAVSLASARYGSGVLSQDEWVEMVLAATEAPGVLLLGLSLWCTPLSRLTGRGYRRPRTWFGLSFAFCAAVNLMAFLVIHPVTELTQPFAVAGVLALMAVTPLALTSTRRAMVALGRSWKRLHRLVYVAGAAVILHLWLVPQDDGPTANILATAVYGGAAVLRIPVVVRSLDSRRTRLAALAHDARS
jgi:methionine sulfoxide reductase heme-binding subunit